MKKWQKKFEKIKHLVQYKNKTDEEIKEIAKKSVKEENQKKDSKYKINWVGLNTIEKKKATSLFDDYSSKYQIEKLSDLEDLKSLIFTIMIKERIQNKLYELDKNKVVPPRNIMESYNTLYTQELKLKERLGLGEEKKESKWKVFWVNFKKKMLRYALSHKGAFYFKCIAEKSLVLMADWSMKPIEEVNIGDEIFGVEKKNSTGWVLKKQKVLNKMYKGVQETVVCSTNNNSLILTSDHQILANRRGRKTYWGYHSVENSFNREVIIFEGISNLEDYYKGVLLGFIKSDGWEIKPVDKKHPHWDFSKNYNICQQVEEKSVDFLLNYFNFKYTKKFSNNGWGNGAYNYRISYSHTKFIDNILKDLLKNRNISLGFLVGFALGDGHYQNRGFLIHQSLKNKDKIKLLDEIFERLNIRFVKNGCGNGMIYYRVLDLEIPFSVPYSKKIKQLNENIFLRKRGVFNKKLHSIKEIKSNGKCKVWDLTTETQNFIVNGFIVHNCPNCNKMVLLLRKVEDYKTFDFKMFRGTYLYNEEMFKDIDSGKITKEDVARYWGLQSEDYINWIYQKVYLPEKNEKKK